MIDYKGSLCKQGDELWRLLLMVALFIMSHLGVVSLQDKEAPLGTRPHDGAHLQVWDKLGQQLDQSELLYWKGFI